MKAGSEHMEAVLLMRWVMGQQASDPRLALFFAVPNGGHRAKTTASRLKAEGVRAGVADYLFPVACGDYRGLAIELKSATGRASREQVAFLAALRAQGWRAEVCRGWEQARDVLLDYLAAEPMERAA